MSGPEQGRTYPLAEAIQAHKALREMAGLGPEMVPIHAFVGMISDEVEALRKQGHSDQAIAETIKAHSKIEITAAEITENYASPVQRHGSHG